MSGLLNLLNPEPPSSSSSRPSSQTHQISQSQYSFSSTPTPTQSRMNGNNASSSNAPRRIAPSQLLSDDGPDEEDAVIGPEEYSEDEAEQDVDVGDEEDEGDGEGEEEEGDEGEEEEDDEDEDDDEESDGDDKSEDLEGNNDAEEFEVTGENIRHPSGSPRVQVKSEPGEGEPAATSPTLRADGDSNGEIVNKPPVKKKRRTVRAASEDMPKPPAPLKTIRLDFKLDLQPQQEYIVFNFMDEAKRAGFIENLPEDEEEGKMEMDGPALHSALPELDEMQSGSATPLATQAKPSAGPSSGSALGGGILADLADLSPEELARRFDERDAAFAKATKKRKSRKKEEDYEQDSLIDDSELYQDAPSQLGRSKKEGFFVHAGALEVVYDEPIRASRPRVAAKKKTVAAPPPELDIPTLAEMVERRTRRTQANGHGDGSLSSPIKIDDDDDLTDGAGPPRIPSPPRSPSPQPARPVDRTLYKNATHDAKFLPPFRDFPRSLRHRLIELKNRSDAYGWVPTERSKFPDTLKPPLKETGVAAMKADMFGEKTGASDLWQALPSVLPYNLFTLQKLVTKTCYTQYMDFLASCEEAGVDAFVDAADAEESHWQRKCETAQELHEEAMRAWRAEHPELVQSSNFDISQDGAGDDPTAPGLATKPVYVRPRYSWTPAMRDIFQKLLDNLQEMVNISIKCSDKHKMDVEIQKETVLRPRLYRKVVERANRDHINNDQCSKEMTRWKAKRGLPPGNAKDVKDAKEKEGKAK